MDYQFAENGYNPNCPNNGYEPTEINTIPKRRRCCENGLTPLSIAFCIICSICLAAVILGIVLGLIPVYLAAINSIFFCYSFFVFIE